MGKDEASLVPSLSDPQILQAIKIWGLERLHGYEAKMRQ